MLRFAHPELLWYLLALPVLAATAVWLHVRRRRAFHIFIGAGLAGALAPDASAVKWFVKQGLLLAALGCLLLTLADPMVGTRLEEVKREGIDLFVALDVSLSMKSEDVRPSRLEKAKRDVSELLRRLSGDRVGLVVFAGEAYVQFPLTADYSAADLFLSAVDVDAVPVPGTMIGNAITLALKSFSADVPTQKAIVVVSDGENTEGDVLGALEDAKKAGVRIYAVGMGTPAGGPIPVYGPGGGRQDYKRDQANSIVLSKLDESMLQQIAVSTGGSYHRASSGGNEIDDIFRELSSLQKVEFGAKQVTGYESRYQYPLAAALLFLLVEVLLSARRTRWFARIKRLIPAGVALLLCALPIRSMAQTVGGHIREGNHTYETGKFNDAEVSYRKALEKDPKSVPAQFNLGDAQYKQQRFEESARSFHDASAAATPSDQAAACYNLGNTLFKSNQFAESAEAYRRALKLNPSDDDARYNFLMARDRLKQQQQQNKDKNKNKNKEQKQQNQPKNDQQKQQNQQQDQRPQNQEAKQDRTQQQQQRNQMPKEEAERILEAMKNNEKAVQKQLRKRDAVRVKVEKDW
jgi:tetratricopeptide (TPR) repeat protein